MAKFKPGVSYFIFWKGIFGKLHEYQGKFLRMENNEYIFRNNELGEIYFEEKEIVKFKEKK